jgi:signal transduction histidine kinase
VRKRAEERERLAAIGETAAMLAHEISNPLMGMLLNIKLLGSRLVEIGDERLMSTINKLVEETTRLNNLLRDFSNLSRRETYDLCPTLLAVIATEILDGEMSKYLSKGIRVELKFEPGLPLVLADRGKIKQALLNVCKNAEEAMPEGGTLTLRGYESEGKVILEVRDTGTGILEDFNLAEPFTTTKPFGSGLGLMIVRQIISLHHGSFSYSSEPGKGTAFFLMLPVHSAS